MTRHPRCDLWILRSLRRIMRAVDVHSRRLAAEYRITGPQVLCLQTVSDDGPMTVTALAKLVHLSSSTVVGIIDRLEQRGWIVRERSRKDRRQILIHVTEEGRELLANVPSPLQERLADGLAELPEKEQVELATAIERIVELLEVPDFGAAPLLETRPIEDSLASPPAPDGDKGVDHEPPHESGLPDDGIQPPDPGRGLTRGDV
ncbi:MarR family transcriptional regulator [bacterium]|nr:MarR family transcriptional regulator [bacterium]